MRIIRGDAFVRAWPAAHGETVGNAALVGIVEVQGDVHDEIIHGVALLENGSDILLSSTGRSVNPDYDIRGSDVDAILRSQSWPRPTADVGLDGGGVLLRRTRIPAAENNTTCVLIALLSTDALEDQTMVVVNGDIEGSLTVADQHCVRHLETNGSSLSQILKRPLWGWDAGKWGPTSTLHLDVIDGCRRLEELWNGSAEEAPGEREKLERGHAGCVLRTGRTDERYMRFRTIWREKYGPIQWDGAETQAQQDLFGERALEIIREIA